MQLFFVGFAIYLKTSSKEVFPFPKESTDTFWKKLSMQSSLVSQCLHIQKFSLKPERVLSARNTIWRETGL